MLIEVIKLDFVELQAKKKIFIKERAAKPENFLTYSMNNLIKYLTEIGM